MQARLQHVGESFRLRQVLNIKPRKGLYVLWRRERALRFRAHSSAWQCALHVPARSLLESELEQEPVDGLGAVSAFISHLAFNSSIFPALPKEDSWP